ncbi:hypothetical protein AJ80_07699 [Polytolypa hystricis UAMH7299]|uniref:Gamma-glutamylcyclotransferase AIG2-like domain-containing protein n=1 Tax=Polytolypa hystricis (strain UAMH7299) TaxID=1447883 RepID=A0A2B7XCP0_POLH7|nr:hypothetical protein AJ80_07699 [Polytolypa hystricis UAMH7299]
MFVRVLQSELLPHTFTEYTAHDLRNFMDLFEELERMRLFHYSYQQAVDAIGQQRRNVARTCVPDVLWELIRDEKEAEGFSRAAYEHHLQKPSGGFSERFSSSSVYLVTLEDPLNSPDKIQAIADFPSLPQVRYGTGEDGKLTALCELAATAMEALAAKPAQDDYPMWYFFYGSLHDPVRLVRLLMLPETTPIRLYPARITGGVLKLWGGRYKAMIDGPSIVVVEGPVYEVQTKGEEDALCGARFFYSKAIGA